MRPPRAILFDLDGTLVRTNAEVLDQKLASAWAIAASSTGVAIEKLMQVNRRVTLELWRESEQLLANTGQRVEGLRLIRDTFHQTLQALSCDDAALSGRVFEHFWESRAGSFSAYEDVLPALEALHGHFSLAVVTNGPAITQADKLALAGVKQYFDVIVASGDIGFAKPSPAIFRHTLEGLGLSDDNAWHVGDSLDSDVAGARASGLTAVWLNRDRVATAGPSAADHEVNSLLELLPLLQRFGAFPDSPGRLASRFTVQSAAGSVGPPTRTEDFDRLIDEAMQEMAEKVMRSMRSEAHAPQTSSEGGTRSKPTNPEA
jgi:putative hydrolase of the HAD superfamily